MTPSEVRRRQTLERKAAFISQVTRGDIGDRDVDDIGDQALSFAEVKALATGDPLVMEKAGVDAGVARLTRLERAHHDDQHRLRRTHDTATNRAEQLDRHGHDLASVIERIVDTRGDRFAMTVEDRQYTKRADAGVDLKDLLAHRLETTPPETTTPLREVAHLGGLAIHAQTTTTIEDEVRLVVPGAHVELIYGRREWHAADPATIVGRLERHLQRLPDALATTTSDRDGAAAEAERAHARIGHPWEHTDELARLRRRQHEINDALAATTEPAPPVAPAAEEPASHSTDRPAPLPADYLRVQERLDAIQARRPTDQIISL